uniref:NAD-dependent epimerase/dehydratase domain-containing protein n=1 Tax=Timema tahoe TaxID=61484 RepID=A0A7R9IPE8_9NEOP|nr:unnamed protein product [Timema tahoe]
MSGASVRSYRHIQEEAGVDVDYVINCACETRTGQTDPVYREGILKLSLNCASEAAKHNVKRFVEVSTGHMCSSDKNPHKEEDKMDPWTYVGKYKSQVEEELKKVPGLRYTVVRPAIVYGLGDKHGIAPRLVIGAVYKHLGEMMKLLWNRDLKMNTVHVTDLCQAIWHLATREDTLGQVYNIVDKGDTTQGTISNLVSEIFNINHDYWGKALSTVCKTDMVSVVEEVNDKHMGPWAEACSLDGVENTPLTPYIDQELLYNKHLYLDGSKLERTGYTLTVPCLTKERLEEVSTSNIPAIHSCLTKERLEEVSTSNTLAIHSCLTKERLEEILEDYVAMKLFPRSLFKC